MEDQKPVWQGKDSQRVELTGYFLTDWFFRHCLSPRAGHFFVISKTTSAVYCLKMSSIVSSSLVSLRKWFLLLTHLLFCLFVPQLQRLKRSLSFKSVMRSKSVDNFFQRSNGESRPPSALITTPPPPLSPPPFPESPLAYERSPSGSPSNSPNPSLSSHSPSISPSLPVTSKTQPKSQAQPVQPIKTHCFQEHIFRRPTSCQRCKHLIQGRLVVLVTSRTLHLWKVCSHVGQ